MLAMAVTGLASGPALAFTSPDDDTGLPKRPAKKKPAPAAKKPGKPKKRQATARERIKYKGREIVDFALRRSPAPSSSAPKSARSTR